MQCDQIWRFIALRQLFKACGNNYFAQNAHILGNYCKVVEIFHLLVKSFLGIFYWSHSSYLPIEIVYYWLHFNRTISMKFEHQVRRANAERAKLSRLQQREIGMATMLLCVVIVFFVCNILALVVNVLEVRPFLLMIWYSKVPVMCCQQCDQIWRFIGLWPTFKCFWQHLICPNFSHS